MAKANRVCYCCGREYYFCPSCPKDKKDPQIYTMWDSELCKDVFNTLSRESLKKITTKECKEKLIELGVDKIDIKKDSVKAHINKVMNYKDVEDVKGIVESIENTEVPTINEEVAEAVFEEIEVNNTEVIETDVCVKADDVAEITEEAPKMVSKKKKNSYKKNYE